VPREGQATGPPSRWTEALSAALGLQCRRSRLQESVFNQEKTDSSTQALSQLLAWRLARQGEGEARDKALAHTLHFLCLHIAAGRQLAIPIRDLCLDHRGQRVAVARLAGRVDVLRHRLARQVHGTHRGNRPIREAPHVQAGVGGAQLDVGRQRGGVPRVDQVDGGVLQNSVCGHLHPVVIHVHGTRHAIVGECPARGQQRHQRCRGHQCKHSHVPFSSKGFR